MKVIFKCFILSLLLLIMMATQGQSNVKFSGISRSDSSISIPFNVSNVAQISYIEITESKPGHFILRNNTSDRIIDKCSYDFASISKTHLKSNTFGPSDAGLDKTLLMKYNSDSITMFVVVIGVNINYHAFELSKPNLFHIKNWCSMGDEPNIWTPIVTESSEKFNGKYVGLCYCDQASEQSPLNKFNFEVENLLTQLVSSNQSVLLLFGKSIEIIDLNHH